MGGSQSTPSACNYTPVPRDIEERKRPRPYGLSPNDRRVPLNSSYSTLYDGIVSLVQNNKYADLLIICGDDRYPVHRAIVCPRSHFFEEQCAPREGECDFACPAKPTKIWIDPSECDSQILAAVLTFLYTLDYAASGPQALTFGLPQEIGGDEDGADDGDEEETLDGDRKMYIGEEAAEDCTSQADGQSTTFTDGMPTPSRTSSRHSSYASNPARDPGESQNELVFHTRMYCAGHRFGISSLCDVARAKLSKRLVAREWKEEMIDCMREIYRQGDDGRFAGVKEDVVKCARSRFRILKTCEGWDDLVHEHPGFAAEMLRRL